MENNPKRIFAPTEVHSTDEKARNMRNQGSDFWKSINYTFSMIKPKGADTAKVPEKGIQKSSF